MEAEKTKEVCVVVGVWVSAALVAGGWRYRTAQLARSLGSLWCGYLHPQSTLDTSGTPILAP